MRIFAALTAGIFLALLLVFLAQRRGSAARRVYAVGLACVALIYVVFAVTGGASALWLGIEILGLIVYGSAALLGLRAFPIMLAWGWALHVAWDVFLHFDGPGAAYTPSWYPWLCLSFDLVIAVAVVDSLRNPIGRASGS